MISMELSRWSFPYLDGDLARITLCVLSVRGFYGSVKSNLVVVCEF